MITPSLTTNINHVIQIVYLYLMYESLFYRIKMGGCFSNMDI